MGERVPEIQRQMEKRSAIRLKYRVSLLTDMRRGSRERPRSCNTEKRTEKVNLG